MEQSGICQEWSFLHFLPTSEQIHKLGLLWTFNVINIITFPGDLLERQRQEGNISVWAYAKTVS